MSNANTNGGQAMGTSGAKCANNAGPPILDIETANRVIENALSGSLSLSCSSNANTNREQSAFNSDIINGHINSVLEQHSIETRELEALERSSHKAREEPPVGASSSSKATHSTSVDKSATNSISNPVIGSPHMASDEED
ncbi:unnamed protein product, partial [Medioppia subpectinata]